MYYRLACSIPDPSSATVLVTGGYYTMNTVSRYGRDGWLKDCTVLYCTALYCTALYCTVSRYGRDGWLEDCTILYCMVLHCTELCQGTGGRDGWRAVLYCIVLHCTVLCPGMGGLAGWRTCHLSTWGELIMDVAAMCRMEIW